MCLHVCVAKNQTQGFLVYQENTLPLSHPPTPHKMRFLIEKPRRLFKAGTGQVDKKGLAGNIAHRDSVLTIPPALDLIIATKTKSC